MRSDRPEPSKTRRFAAKIAPATERHERARAAARCAAVPDGLCTRQDAHVASNEMFRTLPFPYAGGVFPRELGAVVQRTVLEGDEPAREVTHWSDGSWTVADGINDPNLEGAAVATHIWHAIERNSSITTLADMPPGHIAQRNDPAQAWRISAHEESD